MENLLRNTDNTSITTMFPNLDLRISHRDLLEFIGRILQLIHAGLPRDHMPILLTLRYTLQLREGRHHSTCGDQMGPASVRRLLAEGRQTSGFFASNGQLL